MCMECNTGKYNKIYNRKCNNKIQTFYNKDRYNV